MSKATYNQKRMALSALHHYYYNTAWTYADLYAAYANPSQAKRRAWEYCKQLCYDLGGEGLKVLSKNTFMFTAGFMYTDDDGREMFMYISPNYNAAVPVNG